MNATKVISAYLVCAGVLLFGASAMAQDGGKVKTTISLGTAIVNFYSRTPTLLAMSARSIHDLSGGRFGPFGLGAGGIGFMQRGHGIVTDKPLARARETVAIVRGLLTQKKFSYDGQWFKPNDFHLREGPIGEDAPPIWLAGLGPNCPAG